MNNFVSTTNDEKIPTHKVFFLICDSFIRSKLPYSTMSIYCFSDSNIVNFDQSIVLNHLLSKENDSFFNETHKITKYMPNCPAGCV